LLELLRGLLEQVALLELEWWLVQVQQLWSWR